MKGFIIRVSLALCVVLTSIHAVAEDIDLFASGLTSEAASDSLPNVIFVLDNSANWARASQQWPEADEQGQSEVEAIKNTLAALPSDVDLNVALVEFGTQGTSAQRDGGYIRFDLQSYQSNATAFETELDTIYAGINDSDEKRDQNRAYGHLIHDVYNYLSGGAVNFSGAATPTTLVDNDGYSTQYTNFESPLEEGDVCSETYIIFISNPQSSGLNADDSDNSDALTALYAALGQSPPGALAGASSGGLDVPEYENTQVNQGSSNDVSLGYSAECYLGASACDTGVVANTSETSDIQTACTAVSDGCFCGTTGSQRTRDDGAGGTCPGSGSNKQYRYEVFAPASSSSSGSYGPNGNNIDGVDWNLDDWTKFLHEYGVPLSVTADDGTVETYRVPITTYTLDVYNAQPNEEHSAVMDAAAEQGGGYRQSATSATELETALSRIFGDIIDINTSFAAVTLPLSATNRAQAENKVFVGMFRPGSLRKPRWLGNLKQYQLAVFDGDIELADVDYNRAINPQTGFAGSCATSFWTTDTTDIDTSTAGDQPYFDGLGLDPNPVSECSSTFLAGRNVLSDSPDGPFVEKGGAAQQIRQQVDGSNNSDRVILTEASSTLRALAAGDFSDAAYFNYLTGEDAGLQGGDFKIDDGTGTSTYIDNPDLGEVEVMPSEGLRATIHGDIVHSRPLTISYGPTGSGSTQFRIYYGANDGLYRSLDPDSGQEEWAFIAEEHYDGVERLYRNTPTVNFYGLDASLSTSIDAESKDYFFDGSTGAHTVYNSSNQLTTGYIFPTMRRGGRMIYGFDISPTAGAGIPPSQPVFMWKAGCPNLTDDTGCTSGYSNIGQTWSTPVAGFVDGYDSGNTPVLFVGGGWDDCLDTDSASFGCSSTDKGDAVYVIDATDGTLLATLATDAPVVAEVEPLDVDFDGKVDFVYAADAGGAIYRISFATLASESALATVALSQSSWAIQKIGEDSGTDKRFMNRPIVGAVGNKVFVTIGSGDRERPLKVNYPYVSNIDNRFYVLIDRPYPWDENNDGTLQASESNISLRATIDLDGSTMLNAATGLSGSQSLLDFDGWYLELPDQGEQIVNQSVIGGGLVYFNSFQPVGNNDGLCANLGTAKSYGIPLFDPVYDDGTIFGQGIPIPPIIVTVDLDSGDASCTGDDCGPGEIPDEVVTICIGCQGFDPLEINPQTDGQINEAFRVENVDRQ